MNKRLVWAFCAVAMALGLGLMGGSFSVRHTVSAMALLLVGLLCVSLGLLSLFIPAFQDLNRRKPQRSAPIQERDDRERIF